jgi:hypothetical protein
VSLFESDVSLRGILELEPVSDHDSEARLGDGAIQSLEFGATSLSVIRDHSHFRALPRLGLDTVRISHAAAIGQLIDAPLEVVTAGEREHRVQPIGRE